MTKKQFIINSLRLKGLNSDDLIDLWINENKKEFDNRVSKYIILGKEKQGETSFTKNQIRAELISIVNKNSSIFTSQIELAYLDVQDANFRIISNKIYLLK